LVRVWLGVPKLIATIAPMHPISTALALSFLAGQIAIAADLKSAITFHASFDQTENADFALGDKQFYNAPDMKKLGVAGLPASGAVTRAENGKFGSALRFKKTSEAMHFKAERNVAYNTTNWSGSVSVWLSLTPDEDLEPGYTDPIQITSKQWDDAAFFVEFTKDDKPREFRLGAYADNKVWNPNGRDWDSIPFSEKPLIKVERPPFKRSEWTHVVWTFSNYNTGQTNGVTTLYLNGESRRSITPREQTFTWKIEDARVFMGLSYIGGLDELTLFNRALTAAEAKELYKLPNGVKALLR
jgi:hypothetical protein